MSSVSVLELQSELDRKLQPPIVLPEDRRKELSEHYAKTLAKYGYNRDSDNADAYDFLADYFGQWWAGKNDEPTQEQKHSGMVL